MPVGNFLAPDTAEIDRAKYSNALLRNQAARIPQMNRAQDLQIQADEQALTQQQRQTAAGLLANRFAAVASSQSPKQAAQQFLSDPNFKAAGSLLGLPIDQFSVTDQDTDESLRSSAANWAKALGMGPKPTEVSAGASLVDPITNKPLYTNPAATTGANSRYGNTQIGQNGNLFILDRQSGEYKDSGIKASANLRVITGPDGSEQIIDMRQPLGEGTRPSQSVISTPDALSGAKAAAAAKASGTALGESQAGLPDALADIRAMRQNIQNFKASPGFTSIYGKSRLNPLNMVPGSPAANAKALLHQIDAQAFGVTIQKMRGLGQLSNAEGLKVGQAFTRATDTNIGDEEASKAWDEVLQTLELAELRAQQKAGQPAVNTVPQGVDPEDWKYMTPQERALWQ